MKNLEQEFKVCKVCLKELTLDHFPINRRRGDKIYRGSTCNRCKSQSRKSIYQPSPSKTEMPEQEETLIFQNCPDSEVYKEYKYPDGRILRLSKSEFDSIADAFFMLAQQKIKDEEKQALTANAK